MNNLSQSCYNVYVNKVNREKRVTPFEINFFFAICGLPIVLAITLYTGEISQIFMPDLKFIALLLMSGVMGIVITCAVLMVCTICSPVAFNIAGNIFILFKAPI